MAAARTLLLVLACAWSARARTQRHSEGLGLPLQAAAPPPVAYRFAYDVHSAQTGDRKGHFESRQGGVVQGRYSLVEPDGTRRTVHYTAHPERGFNAVVHREPPLAAPLPFVRDDHASPAAPFAPAHRDMTEAFVPVARFAKGVDAQLAALPPGAVGASGHLLPGSALVAAAAFRLRHRPLHAE